MQTGVSISPVNLGVPDQKRRGRGTVAELGQRLSRKACSECLRDLVVELWRKEEAFPSYRFGEVTIETDPMLQDK